jgi:hypothetical protein
MIVENLLGLGVGLFFLNITLFEVFANASALYNLTSSPFPSPRINVLPCPVCSTRAGCLTHGRDIEGCFQRSHEAHEGMHNHQKVNRIRL